MPSIDIPAVANAPRERCYGCFRPKPDCLCSIIPSIDNKTEVLILQHMRERFHPFNTARIVQRALKNSRLLVDHTKNLAAAPLPLKPRAGLLYPGPGATLLTDLPAEHFPPQLVIVDGTWHQAKTFVRDIPALHELPRYRLDPEFPSTYRIRREPSTSALSTLEATVAALRTLEPETDGCDQLIAAFHHMIERQLAHPKVEYELRRRKRRNRTPVNIPLPLIHDLDRVVVAYGEAESGQRGCRKGRRLPVYWVAERLRTGERFACAIQPACPLQDTFLGHLELSPSDFANAVSQEEFRAAWKAFHRPGDTLAVYNQGTAQLLTDIGAEFSPCLVLKSVKLNLERRDLSLDKLLAELQVAVRPPRHPGRAGKRLANVKALVRHLHAWANRPGSGDKS